MLYLESEQYNLLVRGILLSVTYDILIHNVKSIYQFIVNWRNLYQLFSMKYVRNVNVTYLLFVKCFEIH